MDTVVTCLINGLVLSAMYILVALGFALLLSIMGIFNFAHGAIYMVGGYVTYIFAEMIGLNQWASLVLAVVLIGLFGLFLERFCFRPFTGKINSVIVMSIALILIFETAVNVTLGGEVRSLNSFVPTIIKAGVVSISAERVVAFVIGGALLAAMTLFVDKTKTGQQMLAIAQNTEGAALQGIDVNRISAIACVIACSLAAVSGALMASILSLTPYMGDNMLVKAIQVVILSGIGSIGGLLPGGIIIGFLNAILPVFTSAAVAQTVGMVIIIGILLFKPRGLFGYELF